jgi:hypothetical protein
MPLAPGPDGPHPAAAARFGSKFSFEPEAGSIPPGGTALIRLRLASDVLGPFEEAFHWRLHGSDDPVTLVVRGRVIGPTFELAPKELDFGIVSCCFRCAGRPPVSSTGHRLPCLQLQAAFQRLRLLPFACRRPLSSPHGRAAPHVTMPPPPGASRSSSSPTQAPSPWPLRGASRPRAPPPAAAPAPASPRRSRSSSWYRRGARCCRTAASGCRSSSCPRCGPGWSALRTGRDGGLTFVCLHAPPSS